jgi:hypothetical protein
MTSRSNHKHVCVSEEEHEQEEDCTYAGRASGLYPRL